MEYEKILGKYSVDRLKSATELFSPRVSKYADIVVEKENNTKLYDVTTDILDDGQISIFAKIFGTVSPYKKVMDKEEFSENYIIVANTGHEVKKMLKNRKKKEDDE